MQEQKWGHQFVQLSSQKKRVVQTRLVALESVRSGRQSHEVFLLDRLWGREEA